jgi:hypothetical protein
MAINTDMAQVVGTIHKIGSQVMLDVQMTNRNMGRMTVPATIYPSRLQIALFIENERAICNRGHYK